MNTRLPALLLSAAACASAAAAQSSKPVDLTLGYNYAYAGQGNGFANLNGWYGSLNWEYFKRVGLSFEHESFWGQFQGGGVNQHAWLGGLTWKLRPGSPKVSPFLQPMGGDTRSSGSGSIQHEPTFQLSAGADITLKGNLSLEIVPAEYTLNHGNGQYLNTYEAAAALQYAFGK